MADQTGQEYAYASDNPINGVDPSGLITFGLCVQGAVSWVVHVNAQACFQVGLPDSHHLPEVGGNVTVGGGGGTPGASAQVGVQTSNAVHISDLNGPFVYGGGSAKIIIPSVGADVFVGHDNCGRRIEAQHSPEDLAHPFPYRLRAMQESPIPLGYRPGGRQEFQRATADY
jgi:hypothetical protein